jgi:hypothetical protein
MRKPSILALSIITFSLLIIFFNSVSNQAYAQLIGDISNPLPSYPEGYPQITYFLSLVLRLITIAAGLYALINFVIAGIGFISAGGNPDAVQRSWSKIYQTMIGVSVIALSYALAGVLGQLLFGSPGAILSPTIYGPDT